ncbi:MAG: hypothetical protein FJX76_22045 [Armatimonadetes bacterium]|nr:hypothetical protein [Armatimonadota bacterium]
MQALSAAAPPALLQLPNSGVRSPFESNEPARSNPPDVRTPTAQASGTPPSVVVGPTSSSVSDSSLSLAMSWLGAVGLALLAVGPLLLTGCGQAPQSPSGTVSSPIPGQGTTDAAATEGGLRAAQSAYYERALEKIPRTPQTEPILQVMNGAQKRPELFQETLDQLRGLKDDDAVTARVRDTAEGTLQVGRAIGKAGELEVIAQLKVAAFEPALQKVTTLPRLGVDAADQYLQGVADMARIALETAREIPEPGARAAMYESTLRNVYERLERDGIEATARIRQIIRQALELPGKVPEIGQGPAFDRLFVNRL